MKYLKYIFLLFLGITLSPGQVFGQEIFEPEGVNIPGQWNGWTNSNDPETMGNFRMQKRTFGGGQYITTLFINDSGGDAAAGTYNWLFTSGPDDNIYANKWADAVPINIDGLTSVVYQGETDNSITVENGFYYTLILKDNGYVNSEAAVFKTSSSPVNIDTVRGIPTSDVAANQPVTITVELDKAKSPEEKIYVRYSTDDFGSSATVEITNFSGGTTGTAEIPGQKSNTTVKFYVLTTTIDAGSWNNKTDLATINFENNEGDNYSYTTLEALPDVTTLLTPENNASGISLTPDFVWNEISSAETYDFELSTDETFTDESQEMVSQTGLGSASFTVTEGNELEKETNYYWRVRGVNSAGNGNWSEVFSFTTVGDPPSKIMALQPANGSQDIMLLPTFEWVEDATANFYQLQVSETANDFENTDTLALDIADIKATSYTVLQVDELQEAFTYYWRVRGMNNAGNGTWSDTLMFTTAAPVPVLIAPENGATGTPVNPVLSWSEINNAQHYDLQLATDDAFTELVIDSSSVEDSSFVASGLDYGENYYWRVRSQVNDVKSAWSSAFSFSVKASPPEFPQLISPDSGAVNVSLNPELVWEAPINAETYEIQVYNGGFQFDTTGYEGNSLELSGLENGITYFWRVRATNTEGTTGQWSSTSAFTTIPSAPEQVKLALPADSASDVPIPVQFEWEIADRTQDYEFQYAEEKQFIFTSDTIQSNVKLTISDFSSGTGYFWRVRAKNSGGASEWSEIRFIDIGVGGFEGPELLFPTKRQSGIETEVIFDWAEVSGSDHYEVQVAESAEFELLSLDTAMVQATELSISNLENGKTYFWRVRGVDTNDSTSWSEPSSFTTQMDVPAKVSTKLPADSTTNTELPVTFSWYPVENAEYYELQLSEQQSFNISIDSTNISDTTLTLSGLSFDTDYYWKVRAVNNAGQGSWSEVSYFRTTVPLPNAPELISPDEEDETQFPVRFGWNQTKYTESYQLQVAQSSDFEEMVIDSSGIKVLTIELSAFEEGTTYNWRVRGMNRAGVGAWAETLSFTTETLTSMEEQFVPDEFALYQNYPNPFNPSTNIQYDVKDAGEVRIRIYDITGRYIQTLVNERKTAGRYHVTFDAGNLASGIYLMRMETGTFLQIKKMTLIK
jgi:hypothetical protein